MLYMYLLLVLGAVIGLATIATGYLFGREWLVTIGHGMVLGVICMWSMLVFCLFVLGWFR